MSEPLELENDCYTAEQIEDFAELLATSVPVKQILWLAKSLIGDDAVSIAANDVGNPAAFARAIVGAVRDAGCLGQAFGAVRRDALPGSALAVGLTQILRRLRLGDINALQALRNRFAPFFAVKDFPALLARISRTICAIGLDNVPPLNGLRGSGFLVGEDLVMTNYHVLEPFLAIEDGRIREATSGDHVYCFFDYMAEPAPKVPHRPGRKSSFRCVTAVKEQWLVHARELLPREGQPDVPADAGDKYDFAIIRLAERVGKLPTRKGGGPTRGWLNLPMKIDLFNTERVIVYQHPQKAPQQMDVGEYVGRDESDTRVRYAVNTADGSSGGPAVDKDGRLFALHSASVAPNGKQAGQVNQGVRIDLIAKDVSGSVPDWVDAPRPNDFPIWSLTDDLNDPKPIIGRNDFRLAVEATHVGRDQRAMVVWGPPGCGLKFSVDLLKRIVGLGTTVVEFNADELAGLSPDAFLAVLREIGALRLTDPVNEENNKIPDPKREEDLPRWLRRMAGWLAARLQEAASEDSTHFPAWLVFNLRVRRGERFKWGPRLKDFLTVIAGAHDPGQVPIDIPQLRMLFLASSPEAVPFGFPRYEEDLTHYASAEDDFSDCLHRAWSSVDNHEIPGAQEVLAMLAQDAIANKQTIEYRHALSERVRELVKRRLARGDD